METTKTDRDLLVTGIKKMIISAALMFLGPTILYIAFSNQEKPLYIPLIILGIIVSSYAVYFGFKGLNIIIDSMFKNNKTS